MELLSELLSVGLSTIKDVLPIVVVIFGFQYLVLHRAVPNLKKVIIGFGYVFIGLVLFLVGLDRALFPMGESMAAQLTDPAFIYGAVERASETVHWADYYWIYIFAAAIGFSTTIAEPALIAVAMKANRVSGGTISVWGLRLSVAVGAAIGVSLGSFRIVTGMPMHYFIIAGYVIVVIQTVFSSRSIIPLAYDSGGVTTSTVTVPIIAALGLGLASQVPGRSPLLDGFGLIAFAALFPIIAVLGYGQIGQWKAAREKRKRESSITGERIEVVVEKEAERSGV